MPPALADSLKTRALTLGKSILTTQSQWYRTGRFGNTGSGQSGQWVFATSGLACLMASVYRAGGFAPADIKYYNACTESFDYAIDNLILNGKFVDEPGSGAGDLETIFFAAQIAWAMYLLGPSLDANRRAKWLTALKTNVDWIESSTNFLYWANGNWVANAMRLLHHTKELCRQSGDVAGFSRYTTLYERQYTFMLNPVSFDAAKWTGYGVNIDTAGAQPDWSDTLAHLTELGGGPPMPNAGAGTSSDGIAPFGTFDGDYTGLSLEHLCIWFVSSRDFRALKIVNGLANKFFSLVTTSNWTGAFGHGSRHDNPGYGIFTPALSVLQLLGERQSNAVLRVGDVNPFTDTLVLDNWDNRMISVLSSQTNGSIPIGFTRSIGNIIPVILLACETAQIKL